MLSCRSFQDSKRLEHAACYVMHVAATITRSNSKLSYCKHAALSCCSMHFAVCTLLYASHAELWRVFGQPESVRAIASYVTVSMQLLCMMYAALLCNACGSIA